MKATRALCAVLSGLLISGTSALAQTTFIDFSADTSGAKANGFTSFAASGVSFYDTAGSGLFLFDFGSQSSGQALSVDGELDGSALEMRFSFAADFVSLQFGNDDPRFTNPGDLAVLTVFAGATQVGQSTVALNRDDLMNQAISFGSAGGSTLFDRATFAYTNSFLDPFTGGGNVQIGLTEIVDDISINAVSPIPEPDSVVLLLAGLALLAGWRCRRRAGGA